MKFIQNRIKSGMIDMMELFKVRKSISLGLTKPEFIALFYKIDLKKVLKKNNDFLNRKWHTIQTIKKYLIKTRQMAIIFKQMPRGTELYGEELGRRTLKKLTNIFFRCVNQETAWGYRNKLDKLAKGMEKVGEAVVNIGKQEEEKKKELKAIEIVANRGKQ